jgi:hypothetical protein
MGALQKSLIISWLAEFMGLPHYPSRQIAVVLGQ